MNVFITGATGYMGTRVGAALVARGHSVRGLVREQSASALPAGVAAVIGDALNDATFSSALKSDDTLVHLVGTPHPNPSKAAEFERVDLGSIRASVDAASRANAAHLVYVSVAQPAPMMRAYVAARAAGETAIRAAGLPATFVRPWYVVGPGHWWPLALVPFYQVAEWIPGTRATARRLGLVTLAQMVRALVEAVEHPLCAREIRIVDVPAIRAADAD
jgi:nucleoside-diphosphate-sugar epimerase